MNHTTFRRLVIGEKFTLPASRALLIKEKLREEPVVGWVNARYEDSRQGQPCYFSDDAPVVRRRSNKADWHLTLQTQSIKFRLFDTAPF